MLKKNEFIVHVEFQTINLIIKNPLILDKKLANLAKMRAMENWIFAQFLILLF